MATNIIKYDGTILASIPDYTVDSTTSSMILIGKNVVGYGSYVQSNLVRLMENFAGDSYPINPLIGQIWFRKNTTDSSGNTQVLNRLRYYTNDLTKSTDGWIQIADQTDISYLQSEIDSINGDLTKINGQIATINGQIITIQGDIQNIENEISQMGSKFLPLTGGSMTGSIIMSNSTALQLDGISGTNRAINITTGNVQRWMVSGNSDAETGGNNGTNYLIQRYSDAGVLIDTPFQINRVDGVVYMNDVVIRNSLKVGNEDAASEDWVNSNFVRKQNPSPDTNTYSGDLGSPTSKYSNIYANYFYGTSIQTEYADIAERYEADDIYSYGTIVKIGGEKEITTTVKKYDTKVFGVISKNPAFIMNNDAGDLETHPPVVLAGRSPVKVIGKIEKGDFIITSDIPGVGISYEQSGIQTEINSLAIVGRSLSNYDSTEIGLVECFIGK